MGRQRNTLTDKGIYLLPSFLTVMAMFAGFYAIIAGIKGMFDTACVAVFLAMLFDSLDGRVARLVNTETAFGAELDSLSDMLCFGVTPAVLLYLWNLSYLGKLGWLAAFTYTVAVALRLARFNTMSGSHSKRFFQGLASTAAAGFVAGGLFVGDRYNLGGHWVDITTAALTFIVSGLMVSNVPYRSFKDIDLRGKMPFLVPCLLVLVVVLIVLEPAEFLCSVFTLYTLSGPVGYLTHLARKKLRKKRHA
jgi:CDP-diacylglycerol--serine O-phosphatidyltransferase